jgi:hypothetical protein
LPVESPADTVLSDPGLPESTPDAPDGLVLSCVAAALEAPPATTRPANPAVTNVRAPHILPNLAALRALDLNANPSGRDSSAATETAAASVLPPPSPVAAADSVPSAPALSRSHPESPKPSVMRSLFENEESLPKYKRDLVAKTKVLRSELSSLQPHSGHCRLEVSRQEIFEDSYRQVLYKPFFIICTGLDSPFFIVRKTLIPTVL